MALAIELEDLGRLDDDAEGCSRFSLLRSAYVARTLNTDVDPDGMLDEAGILDSEDGLTR